MTKLASTERYLECGCHIGSDVRVGAMKPFIYKTRPSGLCVLNLELLDKRISIASKFLASKRILACSEKEHGQRPVKKFGEITNNDFFIGRFPPGALTNPSSSDYLEPDVLLLTDPAADEQALNEGSFQAIPIVAFCNSFNKTHFIDLIVPLNNNGRKSLAFAYWLLTREVLLLKNKLDKRSDFEPSLKEFLATTS